jgi:hypothetical protein
MTLDLNSVTPKPADWFVPCVRYEGRGRAEFLDPKGAVQGPASVYFDEFGNSSMELTVDSLERETESHFGVGELLTGHKEVRNGNVVSLGFGTETNSCTNFSVETTEGVFSATDGLMLQGYTLGETTNLSLRSLRSHFDQADEASVPKYWVVPLSNFVAGFHSRHPNLDNHPLRIHPTPPIPAGLGNQDVILATIRANEQDKLIIFEFNGSLAFIEPLPDFKQWVEQLKSGRRTCVITAIMVGEIPKGSDVGKPEAWLPLDLLLLLGLAIGTEVGTPWIELRGEGGGLVRREHVKAGLSSFVQGGSAISRGIGMLLAESPMSNHFGSDYLRIAMKSAIRGGQFDRTLEDRMGQICKGFECLCEQFGFGMQRLMDILDDGQQTLVRQALKTAADQIRSAANSATARGDLVQSERLNKIADRTTSNPANVDRDFGLAVADLIRSFGFLDARIVDSFFQSNPRRDGRQTWVSVVSNYRGTAIHKYLEVTADREVLEDALRTIDHCHDILVRLILKMLNYSGTYRPMVRPSPNEKLVDWVEATTPPNELGYR